MCRTRPAGRLPDLPSARGHRPITFTTFKTLRVVWRWRARNHADVINKPTQPVVRAARCKMKGKLDVLSRVGAQGNVRTRPNATAVRDDVVFIGLRNLSPRAAVVRADFDVTQGVCEIEVVLETQSRKLVSRWNQQSAGTIVVVANKPDVFVDGIARRVGAVAAGKGLGRANLPDTTAAGGSPGGAAGIEVIQPDNGFRTAPRPREGCQDDDPQMDFFHSFLRI